MEKKLPGRRSLLDSRPHRLWAVGLSALFALVLSGSASAQQVQVSGTVTSAGNAPLRGVTVSVQGSEARALTNDNGRYTIRAPPRVRKQTIRGGSPAAGTSNAANRWR